jgi:hypothetical protein
MIFRLYCSILIISKNYATAKIKMKEGELECCDQGFDAT